MTTKHTPAPWKVLNGGLVTAETKSVAMAYNGAEMLANARLIAAAPELLAALIGAQSALRKALPFLPPDSEALYAGEWLDEASEAITKATAQP